MQAEGSSGIGLGSVGQVYVGELDAQFLLEPEISEVGATRSVLAEVVWAFWVDAHIKRGRIWAHQGIFRLDCLIL